MIGAALLLAGVGAAGLVAADAGTDKTGSSPVGGTGTTIFGLNGSDTLHDVTADLLTQCNTNFSVPSASQLSYLGGGSGVGVAQMDIGTQALSPMSRAMKSSEYCNVVHNSTTVTVYGGTTTNPTPVVSTTNGEGEGLMIGMDGVSIAANETNSCSTSGANGFAPVSMSTTSSGTYTFGDAGGTLYVGQPSYDALAVLYFGLTHDGNYDCKSDVRKSLIANWKNLFQTDCTAGDGTCSTGLTHAWRRGDLSGTTDALVNILVPPNGTGTNGKAAGLSVGIGTASSLQTSPGASQKSNPFCNTTDATQTTNTVAVKSWGGAGDIQDQDPVRTVCQGGNANENVCSAFLFGKTVGANKGDLGIVIPIVLPDATTTISSDIYPATPCSTACAPVAVIKTNLVPQGYVCPGSLLPPNQGFCFMPVIDTVGNDPRCVSNNTNKCFDVIAKADGRQYNGPVSVLTSQFTGTYQKFKQTGATYQFAVDAVGNPQAGSFYRIHSMTAGLHNVPDPSGAGTTGLCNENDDTSQIGCLVDSDPCSIGYAGREAAKGYPGTGSPIKPTSQTFKALGVNAGPTYGGGYITPFQPCPPTDPTCAVTDPDLYLKNLLAAPGTTPLYPLARRLYVATIFGFSQLQAQEAQLSQCFGTDSMLDPILTKHGFVPIPGGVECLDYPENSATGAPPVNVQGPGNVALPGCAGGGSDACFNFPPTDISGHTVPEATTEPRGN
jgi:hypothetical protein